MNKYSTAIITYVGRWAEMDIKTCCFIGHRKVQDKEPVFSAVKTVIETLITEQGVRVFHFGSRSEFDDLCHLIVTELQSEHPDIVRVNYNRKSEYVVKKDDKARMEESWSRLLKTDVKLKDFDEGKISDKVMKAGKASYVERNQEMIDDSDFCVFYYDESYAPPRRKNSKRDLTDYQPKSGTKMAYEYAVRKKKDIINIAERL